MQQLLQWIIIKYYFWLCICSLRYTPSNAHGPYCHLGRVRLYIIIPHYRIKDRIFGGKNVNENKICVLIFSKTFMWNSSHSEKNWARYDKKNVHWSSFKIQILIQFEFSRQIFEKYSNFMKIRPVVAEFVQADRRTYRHDGTNSRFSKFFERA